MVSGEQEKWKDTKGGIHWNSVMLGRCRESYCHFFADMGHVRRRLQEGDRGWRIGAGQGIVNGGGCEKRVVMTCVSHSSRSPNWDGVRCKVRHARCVQLTTMRTVSRMIC